MTIVATEDSRNAEWKNGNKGASILQKMGWKEGNGLGRRLQGPSHALRAVKRSDETLGIGASTADIHGSNGWSDTSNSFASVLTKLQQHHGDSSSNSDEGKRKRKSKKKNNELTLARNKVTSGHSKKMREAKCLKNKSDKDMAAIFGTKISSQRISGEEKKRSRDSDEGGEKKKRKKSKKSKSG